ncbi:hypothetical protein [Allobranchiibius sp. GilTou38]|uniref:hypothetical protein n=1 Tax=Allobranchiibius sp. GilTou38 TaxID=2815210 RepID=UPI001AA0EEBD|nr:hypothetical protein [Allobranchiibius sp. GilTou38]MBO1767030.1 hypothetical protein [Allobranchiibius sp. GilTou38]
MSPRVGSHTEDLATLTVRELMSELAQVESAIRQMPGADITDEAGALNPRFQALVLREAALVAALRGPRPDHHR